jgi:hypothetical protein
MAGGFIQRSRHGTVFYFRRRLPTDLCERVGRAHIYVSLRTDELAQVRRLARELAVATDRLFLELRYMPTEQSADSLRFDYGLTFEFDSRGYPKIEATDAKPGDEASIADTARRFLEGAKPRAASPLDHPRPTIAEAVETLLASPDLKPTTKKEYRRGFRYFADFFGAETRLEAIQADEFSRFADYIRGRAD